MRLGMRLRTLSMLVGLLLVLAPKARAAGVVSVCDEAHFLAAVSGGGTVTFACSGTIELSRTLLIDTNTTIDGAGQDVTLSGGESELIFVLCDRPECRQTKVLLANLTLIGSRGPAIDNKFGFVTAFRVTFQFNFHGSAIYNDASFLTADGEARRSTLIVTECTFDTNASDSGAAIRNRHGSYAYVFHSTFARNVVRFGAAIDNEGYLAISGSTFTDNETRSGIGAHIDSHVGDVTVANSTFSSRQVSPWFADQSIAGGSHVRLINSALF